MRPAEDHSGSHSGSHSATPIYDALYAEYRRSFRALPGDRSGEEDLGFTAFGTGPYGAHHHSPHTSHVSHFPQHVPQPHWQTAHRQHSHTGHFPAALPPGPRREH
ncbi:hypothetical protein [Streptomyces sp. VRA16 Mangrove soil]|uniref:hypothetical protein n=1 Tax=Streptomyces sp. VRA16 Mangrove soil TaxID=2817434 RepID=UPI001A9E0773|nr:hypothetical protein [Streptomyces sp. VRA16 Mangrove soil]MBO1332001.1 hypothetical protein [Streptomyces sp. VRA16 Mangrove soil]